MDPQVDRAVAEARRRGIDVREPLGGGSYCEVWAVGDALVMRIPRALPAGDDLARGYGPVVGNHVSPTGPFVYGGVDQLGIAHALFEGSIDRQRSVERGPLARFVDRLELGDTVVSLHERAPGQALSTLPREAFRLPLIARALVELHDELGFHGDLKPAHVFVDGDRVTFIDPLPKLPETALLGSAGYALPILVGDPRDDRDEGLLLRDVVALAAIAAEASGVELGLEGFVFAMSNFGNGRFGRGLHPTAAIAGIAARARSIADATRRRWIDDVLHAASDVYRLHPHPPEPGRARALLVHVELRAVLGQIADRTQQPPSLMDFLAAERRHAALDEVTPPFDARDASFAQLVDAAVELRRSYAATFGEPAVTAPPPIEHPSDVYEVTYPLRTLLVDLARLLDPTPATLTVWGGLLARIDASIAQLCDPRRLEAAARRYINYVCHPSRPLPR